MTFVGKAWKWNQAGSSLSLSLGEQIVAEPGEGEIVVANTAIALNPVDWKMIEAGHQKWQAGHIPGVDGAGVVVAVGNRVTLPLGTHVAYHQDLARLGSFGHYTCLAARAALPIPNSLSDTVAAALPCPSLTAWQALEKVPSLSNRDVLVTGGGGAVGRLLAQMAVHRGFRVWSTASLHHREELLEHGVIEVFDYHTQNWHQSLLNALGGRKLFAAFDTISGSHALSLEPLMGYNSHIVCIQDRLTKNAVPPFSKALSQHEVALNPIHNYGIELDWQEIRAAAARIMEQIAAGSLVASEIIPFEFEQLPSALMELKDQKMTGKFVTKLGSHCGDVKSRC